jgi:phage-related protein
VSLNAYIALGSDLPILKSGANEINIDNTVTSLQVKPNWWRL